MSKQARVGLLVLTAFILFTVGMFVIGNRSFIFSDVVKINARFSRVAGLRSGASVQYQGVNVGRVQSVKLPSSPGEKIVVTMAISDEALGLIRQNTQAQIKAEGLVGGQIIVLVASTTISGPVEEDGFIPGVDPFDVFEITDKALASVARFEQAANTFEQIMLDVRSGQGTLGKIVYDPRLYEELVATTSETRRVMTSVADNADVSAEILVSLAQRASEGIESILTKIDRGEGTMALMLNDPAVYNSLLASTDTLKAVAGDLRAITSTAENTANWGALGAYRFAELMEAAKHNWLFKRYFEERGHMEQAPFEVREQALEQTYRQLTNKQRELFEWEERLKAREAALEGTQSGLPPNEPTPDTNDQ